MMGKIVVETDYHRFKPVGQDEKCVNCPSYCKTSCVRTIDGRTAYEMSHQDDDDDEADS